MGQCKSQCSGKPRDLPAKPNANGRKTRSHNRQGHYFLILLVLGLLGLASTSLAIAENPFTETDVKAVFLYNFANFVNWPQSPEQDLTEPFRYCVIDDEIAPVLRKALKGETVGGRPLIVTQEVTIANLAECQVLYLGKSNLHGSEIWRLVREAILAHVLTVSDLQGFETQGGMIALVRQDRRIHPRINIDTVEKGKLRISAKLLNLATIVRNSTAGN